MPMMETRSRKRERIRCLESATNNKEDCLAAGESYAQHPSTGRKKRSVQKLFDGHAGKSTKPFNKPSSRTVRLPMDCDYEKRLRLSVTATKGGSDMEYSIPSRLSPRPLAGSKRPISSYIKNSKRSQDDRYIPSRNIELWKRTHLNLENCLGDESPIVGFSNSPSSNDQYSLDASSTDDLLIAGFEDVHPHISMKRSKPSDKIYQNLLENEILEKEVSVVDDTKFFNEEPCRILGFSNADNIRNGLAPMLCPQKSPLAVEGLKRKIVKVHQVDEDDPLDASLVYSPRSKTGPILSPCSLKLLSSPRRPLRKICRSPFKVLDAPELADDFYLNLVDWSSGNMLAVGLSTCVYLWNANTSAVTRLCDLSTVSDIVTSVSWSSGGEHIAVGTTRGFVQIWDVCANKQVTMLTGHTARVGSLSWNESCICSGSRDRSILLRDVRAISGTARGIHRKLIAHRQEVCGLKWSPDKQLLASGGNDNHLVVWSANHTVQPLHTFSDHIAAVKAIAWSPHQFGLLASGGGTADRRIRFWNTLTGQSLHSVDTGSQVCNLAWSQHSDEFVSTHGYSQNQIIIWAYPSMQQLVKLTGHSYRVLYLACSPDGRSIVTGAGDETLRFWHVFNQTKSNSIVKDSDLNMFNKIR